jgi:hypothetical protein
MRHGMQPKIRSNATDREICATHFDANRKLAGIEPDLMALRNDW